MDNREPLTPAITADAGLYRQWIAIRCGDTLNYGSTIRVYNRARSHCAALAKMIGVPTDDVIAQAKADYGQLRT
jgi:hypothetical protein